MTTQPYINTAKLTAIVSFLGGSFIFLLYYLTDSSGLLFMGYGYIQLAGLVNIGVLISLLVRAFKDKGNRKIILWTCGLILLNIPVMFLYCWFAMILLNTMRVTFINTTPTEMTEIKIVGCEPKQIDKLKSGESKTVLISITGDCSLDIEYISNGQKKSESVASYCTNSMGQKLTHQIGTTKPPF